MLKRLDILLSEKGLASSRERAKQMIISGNVFVSGKKAEKPSMKIDDSTEITVTGEDLRYVGRGGLKLEKALQVFPIDLSGKVCMDIGASTGGFTDCMLQNGADKVYAVDVGHGQLAEKLLNDFRVVNMEKTNIRDLPADFTSDSIDFISIDVSFISLTLVLPKAMECLSENGSLAALIKPQFEAGKSEVGKNGIVKSPKAHERVLNDIFAFANELGFTVKGIDFSPVSGGEGNIEYLMYAEKTGESTPFSSKEIVAKAFAALK